MLTTSQSLRPGLRSVAPPGLVLECGGMTPHRRCMFTRTVFPRGTGIHRHNCAHCGGTRCVRARTLHDQSSLVACMFTRTVFPRPRPCAPFPSTPLLAYHFLAVNVLTRDLVLVRVNTHPTFRYAQLPARPPHAGATHPRRWTPLPRQNAPSLSGVYTLEIEPSKSYILSRRSLLCL
jgi:hypothetical protein